MRVTYELLCKHDACEEQADLFHKLYPAGVEPTVYALREADAYGLDWLWAVNLLPAEGVGSRRDFAVRCVDAVSHLLEDERSVRALELAGLRVAEPHAVSDAALDAVSAAAGDAAGDAARAAARAAAWAAARAAARAAAGDAAEDAAWAAARAAAMAAAMAAAGDAAEDEQRSILSAMLMVANRV